MTNKAIFDKDVIAEWERRIAEHRRSSHRVLVVLAPLVLVATLPPLLGLVKPFPYLAFLGIAAILVTSLTFFILSVDMTCPRCGEKPALGNQLVPAWQIDYCAKCSYWLLDPRRGLRKPDSSG